MSLINISSLSDGSSKLTALSNLIIVTPFKQIGYKPQDTILTIPPDSQQPVPNPNGIPSLNFNPSSLLFQYEGENTVSIESDITDHYSEENSILNDNIALRPEMITVHGYVGELTDESPILPDILKQLQTKLLVISAYTPQFSITALNAINEAQFAYQIANSIVASAQSVISLFSDSTFTINGVSQQITTKQQAFFLKLYSFWRKRTLFTVQTPWAIFSNMVIKSARAIQDDTTKTVTDFEVTFKRFYTTTTTSDYVQKQGQLNAQAQSKISMGVQQLNQSTQAFNPGKFLPSNAGIA